MCITLTWTESGTPGLFKGVEHIARVQSVETLKQAISNHGYSESVNLPFSVASGYPTPLSSGHSPARKKLTHHASHETSAYILLFP